MTSNTRSELEAATAHLATVKGELEAAMAHVRSLIRSGRGASGEYLRRSGVHQSELDAAITARDAARLAEAAAMVRVERARAAAAPAPLTPPEAAAEALRQHAIAVEAHAAAEAAFAARDAAYLRAGMPGRPWTSRLDLGARLESGGGVITVSSISRARIEGFDAAAVARVADGENVPAHAIGTGSPAGFHDQSRAFNAGPEW